MIFHAIRTACTSELETGIVPVVVLHFNPNCVLLAVMVAIYTRVAVLAEVVDPKQ